MGYKAIKTSTEFYDKTRSKAVFSARVILKSKKLQTDMCGLCRTKLRSLHFPRVEECIPVSIDSATCSVFWNGNLVDTGAHLYLKLFIFTQLYLMHKLTHWRLQLQNVCIKIWNLITFQIWQPKISRNYHEIGIHFSMYPLTPTHFSSFQTLLYL